MEAPIVPRHRQPSDSTNEIRPEAISHDYEERFRRLFDAIEEGYCLCEMLFDEQGRPADYRFLEINHRFSEMTGIRPDAEGKTALELVPGLEDWWIQTYGNVVLSGEPTRFQHGSQAMGRYFDVYATPIGSREGGRFALIFNDITARHETEEALKESEERFRNLADNISQFAWMADPEGNISWFNQRWYEYTGTSLEETQGWGWLSVHHPDHVDRITESYTHAFKTGEPWDDTFPLRGRDGEYRWFLSHARPIRDQDGNIVRWFGTNTDITAQRESEEALRIANGHKDQFLGLVSHELRTPVATIITNAWLLQAQGNSLPDEIRQQSYADILSEAQRLQDTIENLLLLTRAETDGGNFEVFDLEELVDARIEEFRSRHPAREVRFQYEGDAALARGQSGLLAMLLDNLFSNADKYSPPESPIEVSMQMTEAGELEVHVADRGIGIPESDMSAMFTPFHRSAIAQKHATGMGLGLAVCKRIIEAHRGRIWVEPRPNGGSDFAFAIARHVGPDEIR